MIPALVKELGNTFNKTSGTTLALTTTGTVEAGNLIVARILFDNATTSNQPVVSSITKMAGETNNWALLGAARTTNATAGANSSGEMWAIQTTVNWAAAAYTMTLNSPVTQKAMAFTEYLGASATPRSTAGTAYSSTTTAASATTTGTTPVTNDLALGFVLASNSVTTAANDTDSTGGTWAAMVGFGSTGGNVATNNWGSATYKVLTSGAHQTLNSSAALTAANGSIVAILQSLPGLNPVSKSDTVGITDSVAAQKETPPRSKMETLTDDFSTDLSKWPGTYGAVVLSGGQAKITASAGYPALWTDPNFYTLVDSYALCKMTMPTDIGGESREMAFEVRLNTTNKVYFYCNGSNLEASHQTASVVTTVGWAVYNPATMLWLKIAHTSPSTVVWSTSPDGLDWTVLGTLPSLAWTPDNCAVVFTAGWFGDETPWDVFIDNFNLPPAGQALTHSASDSVGLTDTVQTVLTHPKTSTISDTFDTQIDPAKWSMSNTGGSTTVWDAGRVAQTTGSPGVAGYSTLFATGWWDATESSLSAQIVVPPVARASREMKMYLRSDGATNNAMIFIYHNSGVWRMRFRNREGGVNNDSTALTLPHDPVAHAWWRIRILSGTIYYDTAPDGVDWTNRWSRTPATVDPFKRCQIIVDAGQYAAEVDSSTGYTDNINAVPGGQALTVSVSDTVGSTDSPDTVLTPPAGQALTVSVSDSLGATDTVITGLAAQSLHSDTVGLTEVITPVASRVVALGDTVGITDSIAPVASRTVSLADTVGATDSMVTVRAAAITAGEAVGVTDSVSLVSGQIVAATDAVGITDSVVTSLSRALTVSVADTVGATDSSILASGRAAADAVGLTDTFTTDLSRALAVTVGDTVGFTDTGTELVGSNPADVVGLTDTVTRAVGRVATENVALTDTFEASKSSAGAYGGIDNMGVTDRLILQMTRTHSDTVGGTDFTVKVFIKGPVVEPVGLTDTVSTSLQVPVVGRGWPKVWTGSDWVEKPGKVWTGSAWVEKPWKFWDGAEWVLMGEPLEPLDPLTIPGLALWVDASTLVLADGAEVWTWPDLSISGSDLTARQGQDNPPTFRTGILNGLPVVRFAKANSEFLFSQNTLTPIAVGHVFAVAKYTGGMNFVNYDGLITGNSELLLLGDMAVPSFYPSGYGATYYYNGVDSTATRQGPMLEWAVLGISFPAPFPAVRPVVGVDRFNWDRYWEGDIAEILVYNRVLTTGERQQVEGHLKSKWDI